MHFTVDRPTLLLNTFFRYLISLSVVFVSNLRAGIMSFIFAFQGLAQCLLHRKFLTYVELCMHAHIYEYQCYVSSTFEFTDNRIKTDNTWKEYSVSKTSENFTKQRDVKLIGLSIGSTYSQQTYYSFLNTLSRWCC